MGLADVNLDKFVNASDALKVLKIAAKLISEDIVILYTNDVHCGIEDYIGYAGLAAYLTDMRNEHYEVGLVDCGDAIQGVFIGTVSKGSYIVDIMNEMGYEFGILGNHEFDYGMQQLSSLIDKAEYTYLGCNISYTGKNENLLSKVKPYEIVEYGDVDVAYIGVATPESYTKLTPSYFMEDGVDFVYQFAQGDQGSPYSSSEIPLLSSNNCCFILNNFLERSTYTL